MAIVFLAGGFRGFQWAIAFFFVSYIQVCAFLWPSDVALFFFSPLPLLLVVAPSI